MEKYRKKKTSPCCIITFRAIEMLVLNIVVFFLSHSEIYEKICLAMAIRKMINWFLCVLTGAGSIIENEFSLNGCCFVLFGYLFFFRACRAINLRIS